MSVNIRLLFPGHTPESSNVFRVTDALSLNQDYEFFGHIVDMSNRSGDNPNIPKKPSMNVVKMTQMQQVIDLNKKSHIPNGDFFLCRPMEFQKIPVMDTTYHNKAVLAFLQAMSPNDIVLIQVSW